MFIGLYSISSSSGIWALILSCKDGFGCTKITLFFIGDVKCSSCNCLCLFYTSLLLNLKRTQSEFMGVTWNITINASLSSLLVICAYMQFSLKLHWANLPFGPYAG
uniref:Uncharacterized protein n=1 Tax=Opuntia streptacantha TaxID=393608 RepID=A0A7C9ALB2_OPUST